MKKDWIILLILALIIIGGILWLLGFVHTGQAGASNDKGINAECNINQSGKDCDEGLICVPFNKHSGNGKCEPAPTATPIPHHFACVENACELVVGKGDNTCNPDWYGDCKPKVTPTPTPKPCGEDCDITPTPTPTSGGNPPTFAGSSTNAPTGPLCVTPISAPILQGYKRVTPTSVELAWWPSVDNADNQFIIYGYSKDNLTFATEALAGDIGDYTINDLNANQIAWFEVEAVKQGCVSFSRLIDP